MTRSNQETIPYSPFITAKDETADIPEGFATIKIPFSESPYSAAEFDLMADVVDWSPSETQVLRDAAAHIRWVAETNKIKEYAAIVHRRNSERGFTLLFKLDDEEAKSGAKK